MAPLINYGAIVTILGLALLGNAHCAVMCGGISSTILDKAKRRGLVLHTLGRVLMYFIIGFLFGLLGSAIPVEYFLTKYGVGSAVLVTVLSISVFTYSMKGIHKNAGSETLQKRSQLSLSAPKLSSAFLMVTGASHALLPCPWLVGWYAVGFGLGAPLKSGLLLAAMAIMTTPGLHGVAMASKLLPRRLRQYAVYAAVVVSVAHRVIASSVWENPSHMTNKSVDPKHEFCLPFKFN